MLRSHRQETKGGRAALIVNCAKRRHGSERRPEAVTKQLLLNEMRFKVLIISASDMSLNIRFKVLAREQS